MQLTVTSVSRISRERRARRSRQRARVRGRIGWIGRRAGAVIRRFLLAWEDNPRKDSKEIENSFKDFHIRR